MEKKASARRSSSEKRISGRIGARMTMGARTGRKRKRKKGGGGLKRGGKIRQRYPDTRYHSKTGTGDQAMNTRLGR